MSVTKENQTQVKRYNPKASMPSCYIPNWLMSIDPKKLSFQAKFLYGRLAQWSNEKGDVFRSQSGLAKEMGLSTRSIGRIIKELKEFGLIDTYQPNYESCNHFIFKDHEAIYADLNPELINQKEDNHRDKDTPTPPVRDDIPPMSGVTPPPMSDVSYINKNINNKEIRKTLNPIVPFQGRACEPNRFEEFWSLYPTKIAKKKCQAIWKKRNLDKDANQIIEKLQNQTLYDHKWKSGFAPNPLTYLNQDRWTDEIQSPPQQTQYTPPQYQGFNSFMYENNEKEIYEHE